MSYSPYQPPQYQPAQYQPAPYADPRFGGKPYDPQQKPVVLVWYTVYCVLMAILYLMCFGGGALLLVMAGQIPGKPDDVMAMQIMGVVFVVMSLPLFAIFAAGPLFPRNTFGWVMGCINIGIGLTSACTLVPCIFLLIGWIASETRQYYGMRA